MNKTSISLIYSFLDRIDNNMKNDIVRKLTSLTLMTIMFAGGLTFAFPNTIPQADAQQTNPNLYVSAEKTAYKNGFDGPMVIEVIVNDPAISSTDDGHGEPSVSVNGKKLRMLQATDGSWYAYFADKTMAVRADATQPRRNVNLHGAASAADASYYGPGTGLDFGKFCSKESGTGVLGFSTSDTEGFAIPGNVTNYFGDALNNGHTGQNANNNGTEGADGSSFLQCATGYTTAAAGSGAFAPEEKIERLMNVVRENKTLVRVTGSVTGVGQLGITNSNYWPFIQLYDFTPQGNVEVKYIKSGVTQTVVLSFDDPPGEKITLDRASYPLSADVLVTLIDPQMNIDPTDEDSWTFATRSANKSVFYQLFNQTGGRDADNAGSKGYGQSGAVNLNNNRTALRLDGHDLFFNNNTQNILDSSGNSIAVVRLQDNADSVVTEERSATTTGVRFRTNTIEHDEIPITFTENDPNSGVFRSWDESNVSVLRITDNAQRGSSATLNYDEIGYTILRTSSFATITIDQASIGGEWNSGELMKVTLTDPDANLNNNKEDKLKVSVPTVKIFPVIKIGSPITLDKIAAASIIRKNSGSVESVFVFGSDKTVAGTGRTGTNIGPAAAADDFSDVLRLSLNSGVTMTTNSVLRLNLTSTGADFKAFFANGTKEGTAVSDCIDSTPADDAAGCQQDGIFHYLAYDLASLQTSTNGSNILSGAALNFTIYDSKVGKNARLASASPTGGSINSLSTISGLASRGFTSNGVDLSNAINAFRQFQDDNAVTIDINFTKIGAPSAGKDLPGGNYTLAIGFYRFGTSNDGDDGTGVDRFNDAIYYWEAKEGTGAANMASGVFKGDIEYILLNQININNTNTYLNGVDPFDSSLKIVVHEDLTDEDSVRIDYNDLAGDGSTAPVAAQQAAPTHSGVVSFDFDSYKIADTVTVTLTDQDLNVDQEVIDIFTTVSVFTQANGATVNDTAYDQVGTSGYGQNSRGENFGRLLDITFDDERWLAKGVTVPISSAGSCGTLRAPSDDGLSATGFTLVETGLNTGIFTGSFAVPAQYCSRASSTATIKSTTGVDMEVNYVDYRDASGEIIEVGDGAGIRGNTGSISLDRTVYPVPWGKLSDTSTPSGKTPKSGTTTRSLFPIHATGISTDGILSAVDEIIETGDVVVHIRINDPDFNPSVIGSDFMNANVSSSSNVDLNYGPIKIMIQRGNDIALLATAGASVANTGVITSGSAPVPTDSSTGELTRTTTNKQTRELGPISEISPDSGIFELDFTVRFTDGPLSTKCPSGTSTYTNLDGAGTTESDRFYALTSSTGTAATGQFAQGSSTNGFHCILQGDIITVEYTDPYDAAGKINTVTDSATFDLRNGVLQSDKSVYIIGSDMILTLIEPDFDRDNDTAETYDLDLIEWDSDAAQITMGNKASIRGVAADSAAFDPEPSNFRETGDSTGIFQIVIEIPNTLNNNKLDRGEKIQLEYTDWGPSGADFVGAENQDINLEIFTSNFGATVELDQKVYTWTDKVFISIVAPDHNFDSKLVDEIGDTTEDPIIIQTRTAKIGSYKLAETGTDTGIFTGEVILAGFIHDANGDGTNDITSSSTASGSGPTDGKLSANDNDGLTVSFEFNEDETVIGSALIRWNIGEVSWLEASYPATTTGVVRVVDPDMNLNPESIDNFKVDVWSDSDAGGIDLTITETNEATGIFEGTVFFTITDESSGHRLRVAEGDTITAEYEDHTLPDPYTRADELEITGTAIIGTIVPPLERAPAANARVVDAFGNSLTSVSVDQQVQIAADLSNGQDREQKFAYLVQIQDESGVTVSLAWITGVLTAGQSFSPALSWIPDAPGSYTATVFVWESVDNPTALSPTVTTTINVS